MEIISETPVDVIELREELAKIKKRDKEPSQATIKTDEYLNSFTQLSGPQEKELVEKLTKLNVPRLKENHIKKIVDLLPATVDDLKVAMQAYTVTVSNENLKKIVEAVSEVTAKK